MAQYDPAMVKFLKLAQDVTLSPGQATAENMDQIAPPVFSGGRSTGHVVQSDPHFSQFSKLVANMYEGAPAPNLHAMPKLDNDPEELGDFFLQNSDYGKPKLVEDTNEKPMATVEDINFYKKATRSLLDDSSPDVMEALETEFTEDTVTIGKWKIITSLQESQGKKKKRFNIKHSQTGQTIASNLWLYEAAFGLVKFLNKGFPINGHEIQEILKLEEAFVRHKADAMLWKSRVEKYLQENNISKVEIYEARFDYSKEQALHAQNSIKQLTK